MSDKTTKRGRSKSPKKVSAEPTRKSGRKKADVVRFGQEEEASKKKRAAPSPSPKREKKQKTKSPARKKSKSPPRKKSKSPAKSKTSKKTKSKSPARKKSKSPARKKTKKEESESESEASDASPKKRGRSKSPKKTKTSVIDKLSETQRDELESMSVPELKERLRANDQVMSGSKKELQERIADCLLNGSLPRCPSCSGGKLKAKGNNKFYCPGSYEDDQFISCSWKGSGSDITRPKWQTATGKAI